jgi:hypothetical protein
MFLHDYKLNKYAYLFNYFVNFGQQRRQIYARMVVIFFLIQLQFFLDN